MGELDQLDQKKVSAILKSHEEILDLFKEIEAIKIKYSFIEMKIFIYFITANIIYTNMIK